MIQFTPVQQLVFSLSKLTIYLIATTKLTMVNKINKNSDTVFPILHRTTHEIINRPSKGDQISKIVKTLRIFFLSVTKTLVILKCYTIMSGKQPKKIVP